MLLVWHVFRVSAVFLVIVHALPHLALFLIPNLVATEPSTSTNATTPTVQPPVGVPCPVTTIVVVSVVVVFPILL